MDLSFFAQMAWKSALISGAALALAYVLRSRSPADRALVLRVGIAMLLLLPFIALWLPSLQVVAFAAPEAPAPMPYPLPSDVQLAALDIPAAGVPEPTIWDDPTPLVLLAYLGGLAMVGSRLLAGLWTLRRWTRGAHEVTCREWQAAFDRVRWAVPDDKAVRLLVSHEVRSPLSWGWRRPVILIDTDTLGQPDDAEAILAHEAAHVARGDWPVLVLSQLAAALFWFNPLVWRLEREVVQQAEEAADIEATERVEPARYAETLLNWANVDPMVPANSIAPTSSALGRRVTAVLDRRLRERPAGSAWTALAVLACLGIAAPVAAMQLVAAAPEAPQPPAAPEAPLRPETLEAPVAPAPVEDIVIDARAIEAAAEQADAAVAAVLPHIPTIVANATAAVHPEAVEQALSAARAEMARMPQINRAEIQAAMAEARAAQAQAHAVSQREIRIAMREAQRELQRAHREIPRAIHLSMANGADGMERGADGMERGARQMEEAAERLQDRDYREREIARARARGETVTHEDLLEAADGLREGAEGMREGAQQMRQSARDMREGRN